MKDMNNKQTKVIKTERAKGLEPKRTGNYVMGYITEIHEDDALELTYKLPLGAIKRLIQSYFEEIEAIDQAWVYLGNSGSWEIRMEPYCYRMLGSIEKELNNHTLDGKKIINDIFIKFFKKSYDEMERFNKFHPNKDGSLCDNPDCPQCPAIKENIKKDEELKV